MDSDRVGDSLVSEGVAMSMGIPWNRAAMIVVRNSGGIPMNVGRTLSGTAKDVRV